MSQSEFRSEEHTFDVTIANPPGHDITAVLRELLQPSSQHQQIAISTTTLFTRDGTPVQAVTLRLVEPPSDEEAEEQEWDALVHSPRGQRAFQHLLEEARQQIAMGTTREGGFGGE
jgi:hypothetical protein